MPKRKTGSVSLKFIWQVSSKHIDHIQLCLEKHPSCTCSQQTASPFCLEVELANPCGLTLRMIQLLLRDLARPVVALRCIAAICRLEKGLELRMAESKCKSESLTSKSESESSKNELESGLESESGLQYYKSASSQWKESFDSSTRWKSSVQRNVQLTYMRITDERYQSD